ncbi:MAG: oxaloacetate decarboxylase [Gammaproteobacteria bacterium]|nr:oxaloacetate decarboxylase [Gammaproteobacteria bacterium]
MRIEHANTLRTELAGSEPLVAPGCYDALTALLIERAGFPCAYLSGASVAFTRLGRPDLGLTTLTEVAETIGNIRDRVAIPLIADGDNGFGNALNVQRTVRLMEKMGASAIQLEDQTMPKRCGHLEGKTLIPAVEMCGKIRAALDARASEDTVIIARTDAVAVAGLDEALHRATAYWEAGADVLFVESPGDVDQLRRIGAALGDRMPLLANMVEGGKTPLVPAAELGAMGFCIVIHPGAMVRVLSRAGADYLATLKQDGTTANMLDRMNDFSQLNDLIGTERLLRQGERYES